MNHIDLKDKDLREKKLKDFAICIFFVGNDWGKIFHKRDDKSLLDVSFTKEIVKSSEKKSNEALNVKAINLQNKMNSDKLNWCRS